MIKKSDKPQFTVEQIKTCYEAFREGKTREEVMKMMGFGIAELNECYYLGFVKNNDTNRLRRVSMGKPVETIKKAIPQKLVRAKCIVSNKSPYGIARPGLGNK